MNEFVHTLLIVAVASVITILLRAIPFWVFGGNRQMPERVKRVADGLPPAIIGVLVIYCLKDMSGTSAWASVVAVVSVVVVHLLKKNTLLSIAVGTVIYMILIRVM